MLKCTKRQIRQLKTALHWKMPEAQRQRIQMILLRESGMTQPAIAEAMGVSLSTVNRAHMAYDGGGIKALKPGLFNALCSSSYRSGLRGLRGQRHSDPGRWCRID